MGRPDKLTDEVADSIVKDVRDGVPMHRAARLAGIAPATLHRWMADGEEVEKAEEAGEEATPEERRKFREFRDRVQRARDELCREACQVKRKHLKHGNPKVSGPTAGFILTHHFSSEFSTKAQVETTGKGGAPIAVQHSGPGGGPIQVGVQPLVSNDQIKGMDGEQLGGLIAGLLKGLAGQDGGT